MFRTILLIFFCIPIILFGQATKKVTQTYIMPPCKEVYYVLRKDTSIKEGPYQLIANKKVLVEGYFRKNQKDSLWTEFYESGKKRFIGHYSQNQRIGIWEYFDEKGEVEQRLDFTNLEVLLYRTQFSTHPFRIIRGKDSIIATLDRPPLYLGGQSRIDEFLKNSMIEPFHKPNDRIKGNVFIEFTLDSTGRTSNHHILKGLSPGCNYEALRIIRLLPDEWFPGIYNGKNVTVSYVIPITFDEHITKGKNTEPPDLSHFF